MSVKHRRDRSRVSKYAGGIFVAEYEMRQHRLFRKCGAFLPKIFPGQSVAICAKPMRVVEDADPYNQNDNLSVNRRRGRPPGRPVAICANPCGSSGTPTPTKNYPEMEGNIPFSKDSQHNSQQKWWYCNIILWFFLCFYIFFFEKTIDKPYNMLYDEDSKLGGLCHE